MSVYALASRVRSVEYSVDELARKADLVNTVLSGTTTINGLAFLNGPVALGSSITGIDMRCGRIADRPRPKGSVREPDLYRHHVRYNKSYGWAWKR